MKRVAILGSTGSIGQQSLDVIRAMPDAVHVVALAGGKNLDLLKRQIREFRPGLFSSSVKTDSHEGSEFASMEEIAGHPDVDFVIVATSGKAGLRPTLAALRAGKTVAIASKEVLVMAGEVVVREADRNQGRILPIDSEHSAIWQCLQGEQSEPRRIILTASGGPFYRYSTPQLDEITPEQALRHPVWRMGKKVTVDSATLMNKGLEVIEAHWLFSIPFDSIQILIHPQSVVHSMVEFTDGSLKAQLGPPDMRLPIQYALSYPDRWPNPDFPRLDWSKVCDLNFEPVDYSGFPCLNSAIEAGKAGGTYPAVLCAADEVAVDLFLSHRIGFTDIARIVQETLQQHHSISQPSIKQILDADEWARECALHSSLGRTAERERPRDSGIGN
ncbi:MAG: 1-deoxy-D-xylulose-5-phosphate reductoisomerase [Dehalococcoidia bacterium]